MKRFAKTQEERALLKKMKKTAVKPQNVVLKKTSN